MVEKSSYKIIPIHFGMVYAFLLKGKNGRSIIIDCGIPGSNKIILEAMNKAGIEYKDVQLIIITHGHSDHMGSSCDLRKITGAKTAIHKFDLDIIRTGKNPKLHPTNAIGKVFSLFLGKTVKNFTTYDPEIIIEGEMTLYEFGFEGKIIETPGHTNGSISVALDDGNIFVGDLIMGGMRSKGKPNLPMYADSIEKTNDSIKKVISLSPKMIYCGHGGPFSLDEIKGLSESF